MQNPAMDSLTYWSNFQSGALYYSDSPSGDPTSMDLHTAETVFRPVSLVPTMAQMRVKNTEKRQDGEAAFTTVVDEPWGRLVEVTQQRGPIVALQLIPTPDAWCGARAFPDHLHLIGCIDGLPDNSVTSLVYNKNYFFVYRIGNDTEFDIVAVTKRRWLRDRNNPKSLNFSKEER